MPFLSATDSSWSPAASVVRVGVVDQSESATEAPKGSCQTPTVASVAAFSDTIAADLAVRHEVVGRDDLSLLRPRDRDLQHLALDKRVVAVARDADVGVVADD